jgi:hypothetical protein
MERITLKGHIVPIFRNCNLCHAFPGRHRWNEYNKSDCISLADRK